MLSLDVFLKFWGGEGSSGFASRSRMPMETQSADSDHEKQMSEPDMEMRSWNQWEG